MISSLKIKRKAAALALALTAICALAGCALREKDQKLPIKVLILPKFEVGDM